MVQFLSLKKVSTVPNHDRYRIIVSHGVNYMQAMLATQLNEKVQENQITKGSIVVIERYTCNYVQEKRLIIVLALRILVHSAEKIGDPQAIDSSSDNAMTTPGVNAASTSTVPAPPPTPPVLVSQAPPVSKPGRGTMFPIEGLSPYQNNWTIQACVMQKSDIKTWSNAHGEGKLFNETCSTHSGPDRVGGFDSRF